MLVIMGCGQSKAPPPAKGRRHIKVYRYGIPRFCEGLTTEAEMPMGRHTLVTTSFLEYAPTRSGVIGKER
jgi:hypothetical protein